MFNEYEERACQFDCRLRYAINRSRCLPWDYPSLGEESLPICRSDMTDADGRRVNNLLEFETALNSNESLTGCKCLPNCEEIVYKTQVIRQFHSLYFSPAGRAINLAVICTAAVFHGRPVFCYAAESSRIKRHFAQYRPVSPDHRRFAQRPVGGSPTTYVSLADDWQTRRSPSPPVFCYGGRHGCFAQQLTVGISKGASLSVWPPKNQHTTQPVYNLRT